MLGGDKHFLGNTEGGVLLVRKGVRTHGAKNLRSCYGVCWRSLSQREKLARDVFAAGPFLLKMLSFPARVLGRLSPLL